ncbi:MAG: DivIVA domain-containing protein [Oscillospiraceae bacterium]|nr:DivIVA domain-containing protein [Oscillospiraceae bacterium]
MNEIIIKDFGFELPVFDGFETGMPLCGELINNIAFDIKLRGYDRRQVDHYLDEISREYNAICEQKAALEEENEGLRQALAAFGLAG